MQEKHRPVMRIRLVEEGHEISKRFCSFLREGRVIEYNTCNRVSKGSRPTYWVFYWLLRNRPGMRPAIDRLDNCRENRNQAHDYGCNQHRYRWQGKTREKRGIENENLLTWKIISFLCLLKLSHDGSDWKCIRKKIKDARINMIFFPVDLFSQFFVSIL